MSIEIVDVSDGVLTFKVAGRLIQAEFAAAQKRAGEIIRQQGKVRFLVLVENFAGTEKGGDWGDVSFQADYDPFIEKIAIVGDKKWEDVALLFTSKGIRRVAIEYFQPADLEKAKAWLAA
jgi:hypothetical protein